MKEIYLSKTTRTLGSVVALVDDEDYDNLNKYNWSYHESRSIAYAQRVDSITKKTIHMHRVIMNTPSHLDCDHINGNGIDNQKSNLRNCTHSQNCSNRLDKTIRDIKFRGVYKHSNKYRAMIGIKGKSKHLGLFNTQEDAAKAYDKAAKHIFGDFAILNF